MEKKPYLTDALAVAMATANTMATANNEGGNLKGEKKKLQGRSSMVPIWGHCSFFRQLTQLIELVSQLIDLANSIN